MITYNFNPIWVQYTSVHVKKYWYQVKKGNFKVFVEFIRSRGWSRSRKKYFRLRSNDKKIK
jgi:hypothetical protein